MILNCCRGFHVYNFQIEENKTKVLVEYENVIQKVLLLIESIMQNPKQLQHARLS
jgi:hypothetical protein